MGCSGEKSVDDVEGTVQQDASYIAKRDAMAGQMAEAVMKEFDQDGNANLSAEESQQVLKKLATKIGKECADSDQTKASAADCEEKTMKLFTELDKNKDGKLDLTELTAGFKKLIDASH